MNVFLQRATEVPSNSFDLISGLKAAVKCGSTPAVGPQHLAEGTNCQGLFRSILSQGPALPTDGVPLCPGPRG